MITFTLSVELEWPVVLLAAVLAFFAVREVLRDRAKAASVALTGEWNGDE